MALYPVFFKFTALEYARVTLELADRRTKWSMGTNLKVRTGVALQDLTFDLNKVSVEVLRGHEGLVDLAIFFVEVPPDRTSLDGSLVWDHAKDLHLVINNRVVLTEGQTSGQIPWHTSLP